MACGSLMQVERFEWPLYNLKKLFLQKKREPTMYENSRNSGFIESVYDP